MTDAFALPSCTLVVVLPQAASMAITKSVPTTKTLLAIIWSF
jgi:hypothetical protein